MNDHANPVVSFCPHCLPVERKNHLPELFEFISELLLWFPVQIGLTIIRNKKIARFIDLISRTLNEVLCKIGVVELDENPNEKKFLNRSLIFFREAKKQRIPISAIKLFGRYTHQFRVVIGGKPYYYKEIPLLIQNNPRIEIDDKYAFKRFLRRHCFPHAEGERFINPQRAFEYGKLLGYPLVVKPVTGSLGFHVTQDIHSDEELRTAISIAQKYRPDILVERHIPGDLFRVSVVYGHRVFVCKKTAAHVKGDGVSSVAELIHAKNQHPYRGLPDQLNTTLHQINSSEAAQQRLVRKGLSLSSVPPFDAIVSLSIKSILSEGCDIENLQDNQIHADNIELFQTMTERLRANAIGFDVICEHMSVPFSKQPFAVIESNSVPYVDMHQFPSHGNPVPISEIIWDEITKRLDPRV